MNVQTEIWNRADRGTVIKAVVRTEKGTFLGATNTTNEVKVLDFR